MKALYIVSRTKDLKSFWNEFMRPHRWAGHEWLSESRVWFETCMLCGAIRFWRVNDTVFIDTDGLIHILEDKEKWNAQFIRKVLREAKSYGLI